MKIFIGKGQLCTYQYYSQSERRCLASDRSSVNDTRCEHVPQGMCHSQCPIVGTPLGWKCASLDRYRPSHRGIDR